MRCKRFIRSCLKGALVATLAGFVLMPAGVGYAYSPEKAKALSGFSGEAQPLGINELKAIADRIGRGVGGSWKAAIHNSIEGVHTDKTVGTPFFIGRDGLENMNAGAWKAAAGMTPDQAALAFVEAYRETFRLDHPSEELVVDTVRSDSNGGVHVRFRQRYGELTVDGMALVVHFDANGGIGAVSGRYMPTPNAVNPAECEVNRDDAVATVLAAFPDAKSYNIGTIGDLLDYSGPSALLCIREHNTRPVPAWKVEIRPDARSLWYVYVDARTGTVMEKLNASPRASSLTATAKDVFGAERIFNVSLDEGVYYLHDSVAKVLTYDAHGRVAADSDQPTLFSSPDNTWNDALAVSAHVNAREVYDYYLGEHNRKGIDNNGMELPVIVHFTDDGSKMRNAFWNGRFVAFGDGDIYAAALDVVAHELTHAVIQYTVGLEYRFQSGALNEAYADVMATMVDPDWEIGEDLNIGSIRDLSNPHRFNLPAHMDEYRYYDFSEDHGGVHVNMSIPSLAAYHTSLEIGRDKTADIWYGVLDKMYLSPRAQFIDMRLSAIRVSDELYGVNSVESQAVAKAFDKVGIYDGDPSLPPEDRMPFAGDDLISFLYNTRDGRKIAFANKGMREEDVVYPTDTIVYSGGSSPVTLCRDGTVMMFVDSENNIRGFDLIDWEEAVIEDSGIWSSITISPDGTLLAATTVDPDSTIYILDIESPDNSKAISLYTASTEGVKTRTAVFADALDWDSTGTQVIYDAFHKMPLTNGDSVEFWDVNILDVESEIITRVKTPTENGMQVGNPSFGETNDRYIVCDLFSMELNYASIASIDLYTNDIVEVAQTAMYDNFPDVGHPRYSPDDRSVVYQVADFILGSFVLYIVPLADDKMTPLGVGDTFAYGELPVWFVRGEDDATDVEEQAVPRIISLEPNYPNPFNPSTTIPFSIGKPSHVTVSVYDILGRHVKTLVDRDMVAGSHRVVFDGADQASGVYLYRVETSHGVGTGRMMLIK